jgi:prepilin-type processing-associated H-X9-DG protein
VDENGKVPPTFHTAEDLRLLLGPHVDPRDFETHNPNGGAFIPNAKIAGKALKDLGTPETVVILMESLAWPDGKRAIGYADGHVKRQEML